jgi:invasion protein IalB
MFAVAQASDRRPFAVPCIVMSENAMSNISLSKIAVFKTDFILIAFTTVLLGAAPLHAQGTANPAEPNAVFIPQARPGQPKKAMTPAQRAGTKAGKQDQVRATRGAKVGALPNGASAISETYGDWTLNCGLDKGATVCTLSQAQVNKDTGQRAFAVELRTSKDGTSEGTILMPFGLKFDAGVILKLDDRDLAQGLRFSTCLAQGCLLPVTFQSAGIDALRQAKTFTVGALSISNNQLVTFNVSLNGFSVALDRAVQLVS